MGLRPTSSLYGLECDSRLKGYVCLRHDVSSRLGSSAVYGLRPATSDGLECVGKTEEFLRGIAPVSFLRLSIHRTSSMSSRATILPKVIEALDG